MDYDFVKNQENIEGAETRFFRIRRSLFRIDHSVWADHHDRENTAIRLAVASPWINAVAHFPNCGETDWREWLADIGEDYIGTKLFGLGTRVRDYRKTLSTLRGYINESRAEGVLSVEEANEIRKVLRENHAFKPFTPEDKQFPGLIAYVHRTEALYAWGNPTAYREAPAFRSFKRNAWQPFQEILQAELDREAMLAPLGEDPDLAADADAARPENDDEMEMAP